MKNLIFRIIMLLVASMTLKLLESKVSAQSDTTGAVSGFVTEVATGQPIPGVRVSITNVGTGTTWDTKTNADGSFYVGHISNGIYNLSVIPGDSDDYETISLSILNQYKVEFRNVNRVQPPPLKLRKKIPGINPNASPPTSVAGSQAGSQRPSRPDDGSRGLSLEMVEIQALPLADSRTFDQLALLASGVTPSPQSIGTIVGPGVGPGVGTSGQFSVNGLRSRGNNFTIDGADNNDDDIAVRRQGFTALVPQPIETIAALQITTALSPAQYGRNLGGKLDATTRKGKINFHGEVFGFYTDSNLNARNPFDLTLKDAPDRFSLKKCRNGQQFCADGEQLFITPITSFGSAASERALIAANPVGGKDSLTRVQGGFIFGGPVTRRRSNFLVSFEHRQQNAGAESNFAVPMISERGLMNSGDRGLTVTTDAGEIRSATPTTLIGDIYFSLIPLPNNPRGPYGDNTHTRVLPAGKRGEIGSVRFDQAFRPFKFRQDFAARYNVTDDATILPVTGEGLFSTLRSEVRTHNLALMLNGELGSNLSHSLRLSYGRTRLGFTRVTGPSSDFLLPTNFSDRGQLVPYLLNAKRIINFTIPTRTSPRFYADDCQTEGAIFVPGCGGTGPIGQLVISGFSPVGVDVNNFPQQRANNVVQVKETVTRVSGYSTLHFGGEFRRVQLNSRLDRNFRPIVHFNGAMNIADRYPTEPADRDNPPPVLRNILLGTDFAAAGAPTGFLQNLSVRPDSTIGLRNWQANTFIESRLNPGRAFTLTLGARYELSSVPREVNRRIEDTFNSTEIRDFIAAERGRFGVSGLERYLAGRSEMYRPDRNNIAPYISLAVDPYKDGRLVLRAGYGIYYDQIPGVVISQSRNVFPTFLSVNTAGVLTENECGGRCSLTSENPSSILALPGTLNSLNTNTTRGSTPTTILLSLIGHAQRSGLGSYPAGPALVLPQSDMKTPYSQQWSIMIEKELAGAANLSVAYVGTRGISLLRFATPNLGIHSIPVIKYLELGGSQLEAFGFLLSPARGVTTGTNFNRPYPFLGSITSITSDSSSVYHSLQAEVTQRLSRTVGFTAAYTWSHAIDEVSDIFDLAGAKGLPQNSFDRRAERGDANFDLRHRLVGSLIWKPWPSKKGVWGGWQAAGIVTLQSGQPFTVNSSVDVNLDGNLTDRLNSLTGVKRIDEGPVIYQFPVSLDSQSLLIAAPGIDGREGRNSFRAPGVLNLDLALSRSIRLSEEHLLELRLEFFNLFNRTHFGIPGRELFAPGLGRGLRTTIASRTIQLALRYKF